MTLAYSFSRAAWSAKSLIGASAVVAILSLVGCGPSDVRVPVVPVSGKISFQGQSPAGAQIVLHPVSKVEGQSVAPSASVKDDGSFQISAYDQADGAPPGDYVATVQWFKVVADEGGSGRGPNVLPAKYASPETSPVKITVNSEATEVPPIEITH
jgi:hypothetical protein